MKESALKGSPWGVSAPAHRMPRPLRTCSGLWALHLPPLLFFS